MPEFDTLDSQHMPHVHGSVRSKQPALQHFSKKVHCPFSESFQQGIDEMYKVLETSLIRDCYRLGLLLLSCSEMVSPLETSMRTRWRCCWRPALTRASAAREASSHCKPRANKATGHSP